MAKKTPLSNSEAAAFCSQMGMILEAGISTLEGLTLMQEEGSSPEEKQILQEMLDVVQSGGNFGDALEAAGIFPEYMVRMASLGEMTGRLDNVLISLGRHYEREAAILRSVRSAVTYPLVMILMMFAVLIVLLTQVMPIFEQVFRQLGTEMSGVSLAILNLGNAIRNSAWVLGIIAAVVLGLALVCALTEKGRAACSRLLRSMSREGGYADKIAVCRFADGMALMLSGGMGPEESLEKALELVTQERVCKGIELCRASMDEGATLAEGLAKNGVFSGVYARMATIGERTGSLDTVMRDIADRYQEEVDRRLTGIIAAIEPAMVIVLSLAVGLILLSVMLPLVSIMAGL